MLHQPDVKLEGQLQLLMVTFVDRLSTSKCMQHTFLVILGGLGVVEQHLASHAFASRLV